MRRAKVTYNATAIMEDMGRRGWHGEDLAREAGLSGSTVHRFLTSQIQTPTAAHKIAKALGFPLSRYFVGVSPNGKRK
jgi:transcriptional regulator with XRE-family HTH domain